MKNERMEWRLKRQAKRISQTEIATYLGCRPQHINQWELNPNYVMLEDKIAGYMYYIKVDLGKQIKEKECVKT